MGYFVAIAAVQEMVLVVILLDRREAKTAARTQPVTQECAPAPRKNGNRELQPVRTRFAAGSHPVPNRILRE